MFNEDFRGGGLVTIGLTKYELIPTSTTTAKKEGKTQNQHCRESFAHEFRA